MKTLELYKKLKEEKDSELSPWLVSSAFTIFKSVDCFVDNPTDEEYKTIFNVCYEAYMKAEDTSLTEIADGVSDLYSRDEISLEELRNKTPWEIIDLACWYKA